MTKIFRNKFFTSCPGLVLALLMSGCAVASRHPVPKDSFPTAYLPNFQDSRVMVDPGGTNFLGALGGLVKGLDVTGGSDQHVNILALSGGGENVAYGAGLLCGWTEARTRPQFDIVTAVSLGSLIAPAVFLGSDFDPQLRAYIEIKSSQVFQKRGFFGILKNRDAIADSKPLQKLIAEIVGPAQLERIAAEHRKGRRLMVMTADLDAQRPVVWDLGAVAASGKPGALDLIRKVMLASASIPVVFPPVLFDVEAGGHAYDELHVDGGVMAQVFGGAFSLAAAKEYKPGTPIDFYLICNNRTTGEYGVTDREINAIAGRSLSILMKAQGGSDVLRAWVFSKMSGANFHFVAMPESFQNEVKEPFDSAYMKALFDVGLQQGRAGIPWQSAPGGLPDLSLPESRPGH